MLTETQQQQIADLKARALKSDLYLLGIDADAAALTAELERAGLRCFVIDGRAIRSRQQFLKSAPQQMQLLDECSESIAKFGFCLQALGAYSGEGYVLLYDDYDQFLENDKDHFGDVLVELRKAARYWAKQDKPLYVLLRSKDTVASVDGLRRFAPSALLWRVAFSVVVFLMFLLLFWIISQLGVWITSLRTP